MRSTLIILSSLLLVGASYGETLIEGDVKLGYEKGELQGVPPSTGMVSSVNTTEKYIVNGLVYGMKIEAGTPTLFLMGKFESDIQGNETKSLGVGAKGYIKDTSPLKIVSLQCDGSFNRRGPAST